MSIVKDIFMEEYDRILMEAEEEGLSEKEAEARADKLAYGAMQERFADMADRERQRAKDGYYDS
jgi:hypothetical protein